jgi:UDP-N-acetylmuramoyl-tripeptide--D-alanyl-D-alanine ligase
MTGTAWVVLVAGVVADVVALARWLRVSQREHYLAGSCGATASRWIRYRRPNAALAVVGGAAAVVALALGANDAGLVAAAIAAIAGAAFPIPMTVLGRDTKLKLTRRATVLGGLAVLLVVVVSTLLALVGRGAVAPAAAAVLMALIVDVAAAVAAPIEGRLLERHRRRAARTLAQVAPTVIAVTGSWGKTSTKNHIRDLLSGLVPTVASPASYNNTAGISLTINEHMGPDCQVLVAELGTYGPGEIRSLCAWLTPRIAVITAIGPMHLERMGTLEAIVDAKAEITEGADDVVLWVDDPRLAALADRLTGKGLSGKKVWRVGSVDVSGRADAGGVEPDVGVHAGDAEASVFHAGRPIGSFALGAGVHPGNAACAVATALAYGIDERALAAPLTRLSGTAHRGTVGRSEQGVQVIDDTFNANPAGARAAVRDLARAATGRLAVVTPGMVELGHMQDDANREFAAAAQSVGATLVVVGWTNRRALRAGAGPNGQVVCTRDRAAAREWVRANLGPGDAVLWENDLPDHYP